MANRDREDEALDALIVLALSGIPDDELVPLDEDVALADEDRAAMEALGTPEEFIARMQEEYKRQHP